ncbi:neurogenic locus notch homolog protein 3-like [Strongylocentrotus purpuratus]|uniref:Uncharacterized protein n=1 Tax=Strongylocentrotus purpuratus TaxID=7668 RepID=A0A7M7NSD1_STRPU|nr:neurogenic locus notch homolog protein 3-like [Strongylocentrotus purpuratus]
MDSRLVLCLVVIGLVSHQVSAQRGSCEGCCDCGFMGGYNCYCDNYCQTAGDCCSDYATHCADPCESTPCQNGGFCDSVEGTFTCTCPSGYFGERCQEKESDPCTYKTFLQFKHGINFEITKEGKKRGSSCSNHSSI